MRNFATYSAIILASLAIVILGTWHINHQPPVGHGSLLRRHQQRGANLEPQLPHRGARL